MQIGEPRNPLLGKVADATPVARTSAPLELSELELEQLTPEQLAEVRNYLAGAQEGTAELRGLTPDLVQGLTRQGQREMGRGFQALSGGGNVFRLLAERPELREKIEQFVDRSKQRKLDWTPPGPGPRVEETPVRLFLDEFDRWDQNRDGGLDKAELGRALQDPTLDIEHAAAFAVVYERCTSPRVDKKDPAKSEADFLEDGKVTKDEIRSIQGLEWRYTQMVEKISRSADQAFVGPPDGDAVVQGRHGSCAFLAALIALAESDPAAIQRMISDNGDGSWNVTFPGRDPVRVTLSRAEIALGANSSAQGGNTGLWVTILEKAYAITRAGGDETNPLAIYEDGESTETTSETLSGQEARTIKLGAGGPLAGLMEMGVKSAIAQALIAGRPVTTALFRADNPWNLPVHHAYTVLNLRGDNLTIRNPWGDNQSGEGNTTDGVTDGRVTVSISEFVRYFSEVRC